MESKESVERKTLKSALEGLQSRLDSLVEVRMLSDKLFDKFNRPLAQSSDECTPCEGTPSDPSEPDIIDLFNNVSDYIQIDIDRIHKNLSDIIDMMD